MVAVGLGAHHFVIFLLTVRSWVSYIYSAPPLKLKAEGWKGCYALGSSYIALPWWAGMATFGQLTPDVMLLTVLYSIAGLGIAIVNDFKSIEGDRKLGLQSLPVAFGVEKAKWITVGTIDVTQLFVAFYLRGIGEEFYSNVLFCLIAPQIFAQFKFFLPDPIKNDVKYRRGTAVSGVRFVSDRFGVGAPREHVRRVIREATLP